jgi:hypothetical protein
VSRISAFYGIVILMYHNEHGPPHFHARYAGRKAALTLEGELLHGQLPPRVLRLVREWAAEHPDELRENWARTRRHQELVRIRPLE